MFAGAGTVKGRAVGALINALRLLESFDMFGVSEGGSGAIKNEIKDAASREPKVKAERYRL